MVQERRNDAEVVAPDRYLASSARDLLQGLRNPRTSVPSAWETGVMPSAPCTRLTQGQQDGGPRREMRGRAAGAQAQDALACDVWGLATTERRNLTKGSLEVGADTDDDVFAFLM